MLLRAGMSIKQALVYNCVSSILCVCGMIVGVCAGNIGSVSLWIFALAGGMFIYIALVDMVSVHSTLQNSLTFQIYLQKNESDSLKKNFFNTLF